MIEGYLIYVCCWLMKYSFLVEEIMKCNDIFICECLIIGVKIKLLNDRFIFFLLVYVNRFEKLLIFEIYFKLRVSCFLMVVKLNKIINVIGLNNVKFCIEIFIIYIKKNNVLKCDNKKN